MHLKSQIYDAKGNLTEVEVYEYFKLKGNIQVRSVFLALKIKNVQRILNLVFIIPTTEKMQIIYV